jgi:hypothetical protein
MLWHNLRKAPDKTNERKVNLSAPFSIRTSNHVHWRVVFAIVCIIMLIVLGTIIGISSSSKTFAYADSVKGIGSGIYWDQACTSSTLSLDWGPIEPGSNNSLTVYIRNEGNSAVYLWLATSNWTPSAALGFMTLNWNYSGQILGAYQEIPVELILSVSPNIVVITGFSFDTIITTTSAS